MPYLNSMINATTIDEVIVHLDNIIAVCKQQQSRIGYFACLYRKMTLAVKQGIADNIFANGSRMELLDVNFANRYLQAWEANSKKERCTRSWSAVFASSATNSLIVLQHLVLGINTHINLDLAIAAAQTCPGNQVFDLEADFNKINDIIGSLMQNVQDDLTAVWPPLKLITAIANHQQDAILNFSITTARKASWANALALAALPQPAVANYIDAMDNTVAELAKRIIHPGFTMRMLLSPVLKMEHGSVNDIIDMLHD